MFYQIGQFEEGKGVYAGRCDGWHVWVALKEAPRAVDWKTAGAYCREIGHKFRLPTQKELMLMYANSDIISPSLIAAGGDKLQLDPYWSCTEFVGTYRAIKVNFLTGYAAAEDKVCYYLCRPVFCEPVKTGE